MWHSFWQSALSKPVDTLGRSSALLLQCQEGVSKNHYLSPCPLQNLQPKSTSSDNGVSLDPNLPNALPGPLRLATQQQSKTAGYQAQPTTAYTATDGTAFAGTPVDKLPGPLRIDATTPFDGPSVSGSEISLILGTRIATPFFGTGFNFCVGTHHSCRSVFSHAHADHICCPYMKMHAWHCRGLQQDHPIVKGTHLKCDQSWEHAVGRLLRGHCTLGSGIRL